MKFAFQLAEIIYSQKGVFFVSCLKAMKVCVITYVCTVFCEHSMSKPRDLMESAEGRFS